MRPRAGPGTGTAVQPSRRSRGARPRSGGWRTSSPPSGPAISRTSALRWASNERQRLLNRPIETSCGCACAITRMLSGFYQTGISLGSVRQVLSAWIALLSSEILSPPLFPPPLLVSRPQLHHAKLQLLVNKYNPSPRNRSWFWGIRSWCRYQAKLCCDEQLGWQTSRGDNSTPK